MDHLGVNDAEVPLFPSTMKWTKGVLKRKVVQHTLTSSSFGGPRSQVLPIGRSRFGRSGSFGAPSRWTWLRPGASVRDLKGMWGGGRN